MACLRLEKMLIPDTSEYQRQIKLLTADGEKGPSW